MALEIFLIILGFVLLIKGADLLVDGGSDIAKKFHIPEIVIGLTIVSIGTSMPEFVVSLTSALDGHSDMAIGNIVGSNIANLFLILGLCAVIRGLQFKRQTRVIENPITLIVTVLFMYLANNTFNGETNVITRPEGMILVTGSILFIIYNIVMAKRGETFDKADTMVTIKIEEKQDVVVIKSLIFIVLGIIGLKFGGDLIIDNSVALATKLGMTEKLISLTILAVATSLPELITSVTAARKGETDMAIGNILGSQIFNILLIIGVSAWITPITYSVTYNKDLILLICGTILLALFPYIGKKDEMTRVNGIIFLIIFVGYMANLISTNI